LGWNRLGLKNPELYLRMSPFLDLVAQLQGCSLSLWIDRTGRDAILRGQINVFKRPVLIRHHQMLVTLLNHFTCFRGRHGEDLIDPMGQNVIVTGADR